MFIIMFIVLYLFIYKVEALFYIAFVHKKEKVSLLHTVYQYLENESGAQYFFINILFNLGRCTADISNILKKFNLIVVLLLSDVSSIKMYLDSISEFLSYNKNIIVIETIYKIFFMLEANNFLAKKYLSYKIYNNI